MLCLTFLFFIFFGLGEPNLVIDHDGTVDGLISAVLQLKYNPRRVKGIVIAPADSFAQPDVWFTKMMIKKFRRGLPEIPYGFTIREGINLFPQDWRNDSYAIAKLPFWANETTLNQTDLRRTPSSIATFIKVLEKFDENETDVLTTGPMNNIADILIVRPELKSKIRRVFAMGGAVNVRGNVEEKDKDGTQEWNAFNDPMSFDYMLKSGINLTIVPLDATQYTPVTPEFKAKIRAMRATSNHSELISQALDIIEDRDRELSQFFMDTLTSIVALDPTVVKTEKMNLYCIQKGAQEGRTLKNQKGKEVGGWVDVAIWANQTKFEQAVLDILAGNYTPPTQEVVEAHYALMAKEQAEREAAAAAQIAAQAAASAHHKARAAAKHAKKQAQKLAWAQAQAKARVEAAAAQAQAQAQTAAAGQKKAGEL